MTTYEALSLVAQFSMVILTIIATVVGIVVALHKKK